MFACGMSVRKIQGSLVEHYGTEVSPNFISSVTDEVMAEALSWQSRPLETMYPVVSFDALRVKIRDDGVVSNKALYLLLGIQADRQRDVLGLQIEQTEGAKFCLKAFNDLFQPLRPRRCERAPTAVTVTQPLSLKRDSLGGPPRHKLTADKLSVQHKACAYICTVLDSIIFQPCIAR